MKNIFAGKCSAFIILLLFTSCGAPSLTLKKSDHFNGKTFFNPNHPRAEKSLWTVLKWRMFTERAEWPENVPITQKKVPQARTNSGELSLTFINHATALIQLDGINIITDPIWSKRTSPLSWVGPKRVRLPGVKFEDLPKIDIVIISHNHYDHMDLPTIKRLVVRDNPIILYGVGSDYYLGKKLAKNTVELDWNQSYQTNNLKITFLRSRHWSKRNLGDYNKCLWGAFAIEGTKKVYFAGDTGYDDHFQEYAKKFGHADLSLIPVGAYEPRWFMKAAHINPEEAVQAHHDLKSRYSVGIHHSTFQLTDEGIDEPRLELQKALAKKPSPYPFVVLENGDSVEIIKN